jgi:hypothetical protein
MCEQTYLTARMVSQVTSLAKDNCELEMFEHELYRWTYIIRERKGGKPNWQE